jgi:hemerythrin-like metal-binding protein
MNWTAGYPESFRFLDDEHAEIGVMLAKLSNALTSGDESPVLVSKRLFNKITEHTSHEEELMRTCDYPERQLHTKYHEHVIHSIELILQMFNQKGMAEHGQMIAKHIENKMAEEMFVDRLFAEFLAARGTRT